MKAVDQQAVPPTQWAGICNFKLLTLLVCILLTANAKGQTCDWNTNPLHHGERINYDIYYKWGLIFSKAGSASFEVRDTFWDSQSAWRYNLLFQSSGMLETFHKMRDTLTTYFSPANRILFASKHTDEGNFYLVDELSFSRTGANTYIHSYRRTRTAVRIDTTLTTDACVYDMLGAVMYFRSIDWENLRPGAEFPFHVAVGKDIVNVRFRYTGPETVKQSESAKYRTHHFHIDVYDPAFSQSKEAAEVWVGDDQNHIPVRVRARLKVGAVEVYFKASANLQYPLDCRIGSAK